MRIRRHTRSTIRKTPNKEEWCVYAESGRNMGCYPSKKKAEKRLEQVEMFKHMEGGAMGDVKIAGLIEAKPITWLLRDL